MDIYLPIQILEYILNDYLDFYNLEHLNVINMYKLDVFKHLSQKSTNEEKYIVYQLFVDKQLTYSLYFSSLGFKFIEQNFKYGKHHGMQLMYKENTNKLIEHSEYENGKLIKQIV